MSRNHLLMDLIRALSQGSPDAVQIMSVPLPRDAPVNNMGGPVNPPAQVAATNNPPGHAVQGLAPAATVPMLAPAAPQPGVGHAATAPAVLGNTVASIASASSAAPVRVQGSDAAPSVTTHATDRVVSAATRDASAVAPNASSVLLDAPFDAPRRPAPIGRVSAANAGASTVRPGTSAIAEAPVGPGASTVRPGTHAGCVTPDTPPTQDMSGVPDGDFFQGGTPPSGPYVLRIPSPFKDMPDDDAMDVVTPTAAGQIAAALQPPPVARAGRGHIIPPMQLSANWSNTIRQVGGSSLQKSSPSHGREEHANPPSPKRQRREVTAKGSPGKPRRSARNHGHKTPPNSPVVPKSGKGKGKAVEVDRDAFNVVPKKSSRPSGSNSRAA